MTTSTLHTHSRSELAGLLSQNLGARFPNVTRDAILSGLASGRSLGQTLQDLGLNSDEAKEARKQADREIKAARKND